MFFFFKLVFKKLQLFKRNVGTVNIVLFHSGYGMVERFCRDYKDDIKLTTQRERKIKENKENALTLEQWANERDEMIKRNFEALPMCREQIFLVDAIKLTSKTSPEVDFKVIVSIPKE